ncbi:lytic transglycosylase domain-containing protein [Rhodococcus kronopolitis]|uniref:Lytic murein transglycosylase n=1 Tax=Rhodococcus kronopolitis TaxID=1460226 RepID=A0ABV9FWP0_9NOCA
MRLRGIATAATIGLVSLATAASSVGTVTAADLPSQPAPAAVSPEPLPAGAPPTGPDAVPTGTVGLVGAAPRPVRTPRAYTPPPPVVFELPPAVAEKLTQAPVSLSALGIPELVLGAYRAAEATMSDEAPGCGVSWHLLAGIGRIESGHAGGGRTDAAGTTVTRILGPTLDGTLAGNNVITDTDGGRLDGDLRHDRAVGPMQFIPGTWARYAADGNDDDVSDPNNIFDATLAAARYLCSGGLNLHEPAQELKAVLRYNNSAAYATNVLAWSAAYAAGGTPAPGSIPDVPAEPAKPGEPGKPGDPAKPDDRSPALNASAPTPPTSTPTTPPPAPLFPGLPALPELPCLIFCPPPPAPVQAPPAPAPAGNAAPAPAGAADHVPAGAAAPVR